MRIAVDVRATQTLHCERGIGRSVVDLVHALAREGGGHEYGLLHFRDLPLPLADLPAHLRLVPVEGPMLNGPVHAWPMRVPRLRSRPLGRDLDDRILAHRHRRGLARALATFRPDVLHLAAPIDAFADADLRFEGRTVMTFFDAIPRLDPARHYDPLPALVRRLYDRQFARFAKADAVLAISRSSREEALRYAGTDPARTFVVYLAASDEFAQPSTASVPFSEPYLLFLSALEPHKNPEGVVRAFARSGLDDHRLVMVASERSSLYNRISELIRELGVRATITGFVPDEALRAIVQGATALVSPSFYEGFGLPAAQAMRAGVPTIASDRTSQPEVVGDAGIQVDPDDLDALADAMARLARDPALRAELSAQGRARAARFSLERLARNTVDVYEGRPPSDPAV